MYPYTLTYSWTNTYIHRYLHEQSTAKYNNIWLINTVHQFILTDTCVDTTHIQSKLHCKHNTLTHIDTSLQWEWPGWVAKMTDWKMKDSGFEPLNLLLDFLPRNELVTCTKTWKQFSTQQLTFWWYIRPVHYHHHIHPSTCTWPKLVKQENHSTIWPNTDHQPQCDRERATHTIHLSMTEKGLHTPSTLAWQRKGYTHHQP